MHDSGSPAHCSDLVCLVTSVHQGRVFYSAELMLSTILTDALETSGMKRIINFKLISLPGFLRSYPERPWKRASCQSAWKRLSLPPCPHPLIGLDFQQSSTK